MSTPDTSHWADVDPLVLTAPARLPHVLSAALIDLALPAAVVIAGAIAFAGGNPGAGALLILLALAAVAVIVRSIARTGRGPGGLAAGLRVVSRETGAAAGIHLVTRLFSGGLLVADIRRGRDPFAPALAPFAFPASAAQPAPPRRRSGAPEVRLDSGERLALDAALVLGRVPSTPADEPAEVYQWPDLSRTLSKSHTRLEWDGSRLWVTDLGSTNGTFVLSGGAAQPLLAHQRTPLPLPADLGLGDRALRVEHAA